MRFLNILRTIIFGQGKDNVPLTSREFQITTWAIISGLENKIM